MRNQKACRESSLLTPRGPRQNGVGEGRSSASVMKGHIS